MLGLDRGGAAITVLCTRVWSYRYGWTTLLPEDAILEQTKKKTCWCFFPPTNTGKREPSERHSVGEMDQAGSYFGVLSCLVFLSRLVLSCLLVLPCLALSCLVLSCLVLSCLVLSYLVLSCRVVSCLVLSCLVLSSLLKREGAPVEGIVATRIGLVQRF